MNESALITEVRPAYGCSSLLSSRVSAKVPLYKMIGLNLA